MSDPEASVYSVVSLQKLNINAVNFVSFCEETVVDIGGDRPYRLLTRPMAGFYEDGESSPGAMQLRIAYTLPPEEMALVPQALLKLLHAYLLRSR